MKMRDLLAQTPADLELVILDPHADGYWCLHCETCTRFEDLDVVEARDGLRRWRGLCPHCGAGPFDLWEIGGDFTTGEVVNQYGDDDRFNQLRDALRGDS